MTFTIKYNTLEKHSPIIKFIKKSSNETLLHVFCLGYKHMQHMESTEIGTILTDVISNQSIILEKNNKMNIKEYTDNVKTQLVDIQNLHKVQHDLVRTEISSIRDTLIKLPNEFNRETPALTNIISKLNKLENPHDKTIMHIKSLEKTIQNQYNEFIDKRFHKLTEDIIEYGKKQSSQRKGVDGEILIRDKLKYFFSSAEIVDTRFKGHKGDFIFKRCHNGHDVEILIEVKNYSNTVPKREVIKFKQDIKTNNYKLGILISLNAGIYGYEKMTEEIKDDTIMIYIPNADETCFSLYYAIILAECVSKYTKCNNTKHNYPIDKSPTQIEPTDVILNNIINAMTPIKQTVDIYKVVISDLEQMKDKIIKDLNTMVKSTTKKIQLTQENVHKVVDSIIEGCNKIQSPMIEIDEVKETLYEIGDEIKIPSNLGTFIIKIRKGDVILLEESTDIQIYSTRPNKSLDGMSTAIDRCKETIEYIKTNKKYIPLKRRTMDNPIPTFIPEPILNQTK